MAYSFDEHWITETLRLRESLWGPLEDASEAGKARAVGGDFEARLLTRSRLLARREQLDETLARWRQVARLMLIAFALAAIVAGGSAAGAALGAGGQSVNLALAVTTLLGLNTLAFLFWLVSFGMQTGATGSLLADAWLRLTRRLARGPDAALLPRALLELTTRQGALRWSAGVFSHALWVIALLSALLTLFALLAARRYTFHWETTVLSPEVFIAMVRGLGWLPSLVGFPQPSAEIIRASGGEQGLAGPAHALWSAWLLGVVVFYGLIPRVVALAFSAIVMRRRLARLTIDPSLPGFAELHDRLMPASVRSGVDAPAPPVNTSSTRVYAPHGDFGGNGLVGLELPDDLVWPAVPLPEEIEDLGIIDTREERHRVLDTLRRQPARRLLVCCDARQTPDRGALALLSELATLTSELQIVLLPDDDSPARREQWRHQLINTGFNAENLAQNTTWGVEWLSRKSPE